MVEMFLEMFKLIGIDLLLIALFGLLLVPLFMYRRAAFAVLKRNFVGYFSNPTGYAFLVVFVSASSIAAFVPHDFFGANLANLNQLNHYLPVIMLVFIPAITMSIWAEERRQGTDELLLTLPASDFDIVVGKYLAAAAIFTVSLVFSQLCNYAVLVALTLGDLDTGLMFTTYFGYWMVGLAMLALGMVASFLTSNLTVGFILGALFNAPLAALVWADTIIPWPALARAFSRWSITAQFDDFGRGVVSLSSLTYFAMVIAVGLYLSMVLIGRRHWLGGRDGHSLLGHFLVRSVALIVIAVGLNLILSSRDVVRLDTTQSRINSLSPDTRKLIANLQSKHPIYIDAFVGEQLPEDYIKTRHELIAMLREFKAISGGKVDVRIHENLQPFSREAAQADDRFGIKPQTVRVRSRGAYRDEEVILGAAFTSGLEKVVVPFFEPGIPVEYELIRSINTVSRGDRKRLGVVRTDAQLMGGFTFAGGQPDQTPKQAIIEELEKQYDVEEVDPNEEIAEGKYDALLVVQPSSLTQPELDNVVDVIRKGQPTAVFEDPLPFMIGAPGTSQPKRPNPMMAMFGGGQPPPKGDISKLWNVLGIRTEGQGSGPGSGPGSFEASIVWQRYNPYRKLQVSGFGDEWVFIRPEAPGAEDPFNPAESITSGLEEVLFPSPGGIQPVPGSELQFTELVKTGKAAGTIGSDVFMENQNNPMTLQMRRGKDTGPYILAARIHGDLANNQSMSDLGSPLAQAGQDPTDHDHAGHDHSGHGHAVAADSAPPPAGPPPINVVYVADIDVLSTPFVRLRAQPEQEFNWRFDNVTFVLNVLDVLSGDDDYVEIRKRKTRFSTLRVVEEFAQNATEEELNARLMFEEEYEKALNAAQRQSDQAIEKFQTIVNELQDRQRRGESVDPSELQSKLVSLAMQQRVANQSLENERERLENDRDRNIKNIRRATALRVEGYQNSIKTWAVVLPPLPPLLVGLVVFVRRRLREREGVSRSRLR